MKKPTHIIVLLLTLAAAVLRILYIDSLPPAAWWDEIWYSLRAREILATGTIPVHFETDFGGANAGPVYMTVLAHLMGFDTVWGGRVTAALAGVISVPLAYACFRELLRPEEIRHREWIATLAAAVLTYTLFYTTIGRIGMENGVAVPMALFVIWQMGRGINQGKWSGWLLAGAVGGAMQYNGLHARFVLPLMMLYFALAFITSDRRRHMLLGGVALAVPGVLFSLPLSLFFLNNPEWFTARADIVTSVGPGTPYPTINDMYRFNFRVITRVFFLEGSYDPKNGIPGVPMLDPIQAVGFIVGLGWALRYSLRSTLARLLPLWLLLMCMPSFLTEGAPNIGRMIGVAAPTAGLVAIGWVLIYQVMRQRVGAISQVMAVLVLLSAGLHTWRLFAAWPQVPTLRRDFTAESVDTARKLVAWAEEGHAVFVDDIPELEGDFAAFDFLFPSTPVQRVDLRKCLPVPHQRAQPTSYLIMDRNLTSGGVLSAAYPDIEVKRTGIDLWSAEASLLTVPAGASAPPPPQPADADFANGVSLYGFEWTGPQVTAGEPLLLTTYWHMQGDLSEDLTAFAHLGTDPIVAQRDDQPCLGLYPTSRWQPGDIVPDGFAVIIPPETPPGDYTLSVGWYAWPSLEPLPLLEAEQPLPGQRAAIGTVTVVAP